MADPWAAQWVWLAGKVGAPDSYTCFRAEVDLDADRATIDAVLRISADLRYRLWVNGVLVGDGPPPARPDAVFYDRHDLSAALRPGTNCLAVVVRCTGDEPGRRAGLLAQLDGPSGVLLATGVDPSWRAWRSDAWSPAASFWMNRFDAHQEIFDARREPTAWRLAGFDDSAWDQTEIVASAEAGVRTGQWSRLTERPIPFMHEDSLLPMAVSAQECLWLETRSRVDLSIGLSQAGRPLQAARVTDLHHLTTGAGPVIMECSDDHLSDRQVDGVHDPCVLADFGREETAYLELDVEGPAGARIDLGTAERLVDGHFNNAIEGQFAARYVLRAGRQQWRTTSWRGMRYLRLRVSQAEGPVTVHGLRAIRTRYPFVERGDFASDDDQLNQIFQVCRHTVRLCCHESIMDTPWREQAQWLGDVSAVTAPAVRTLFADTALVEKFIDQAALTVADTGTLASISNAAINDGARPEMDIPDYTLWWVIDLLRHHRFTGRDRLIDTYLPVVAQIMNGMAHHHTPHGTLASFGWVFIDWADVDCDGESAALNAIYYAALRAAAELADLGGSVADRDRWTAAADGLRTVYPQRFWSSADEAFVDAVHPDGEPSAQRSEHTNFAAICFGLIEGEPAARLADRILADPSVTEAQPFFTTVVVDGLRRIGRTDLALEVIRERWGGRMLDRGASSCFEEWGINGSWRSGRYAGFMRTLSHAWSAHPASFLISGLAGIEILEPGCGRLRIRPHVEIDFTAVFPTPLGDVTVEVRDGSVTVDAPDRIRIEQ